MIKNINELLPKYLDIIEGNRLANYLQTKKIHKKINHKETLINLWKIHNNKNLINNSIKFNNEISLLDLKIEISSRILKNCVFCENRCRVNRKENVGKCIRNLNDFGFRG